MLAGFHEVVVAPSTIERIKEHKAAGKSLWRVSSTLFGHIQSDQILEPLGDFATTQAIEKFPPILAGNQVNLKFISDSDFINLFFKVKNELLAISLAKENKTN